MMVVQGEIHFHQVQLFRIRSVIPLKKTQMSIRFVLELNYISFVVDDSIACNAHADPLKLVM